MPPCFLVVIPVKNTAVRANDAILLDRKSERPYFRSTFGCGTGESAFGLVISVPARWLLVLLLDGIVKKIAVLQIRTMNFTASENFDTLLIT